MLLRTAGCIGMENIALSEMQFNRGRRVFRRGLAIVLLLSLAACADKRGGPIAV